MKGKKQNEEDSNLILCFISLLVYMKVNPSMGFFFLFLVFVVVVVVAFFLILFP